VAGSIDLPNICAPGDPSSSIGGSSNSCGIIDTICIWSRGILYVHGGDHWMMLLLRRLYML